MFSSFLFEKLSHLKKLYSSETDFVQHLLSGEVTVPIPDLLKYVEEYNSIELPSRHKIGDKVVLNLVPKDYKLPSGVPELPGLTAFITAVHFTRSKVKYDLEIRFYDDMATRIYNIDSVFVFPFHLEDQPIQ